MTEDWELDFTNPPRIPPPVYVDAELVPEHLPPVQCQNCYQAVPQPFYVAIHYEMGITEHVPFCDNLCHELWYLRQLRESGL